MADELVRRTGGADWVPYWAAARARELRFQRCSGCRRWRHPPGPMCPHCLSPESEWARASGRARLVSWVVVHPPVLPAWKDRVPYPVVLVECEEVCGRSAASSARRPTSSAWTCRWWSISRPRRTRTSSRSGARRDDAPLPNAGAIHAAPGAGVAGDPPPTKTRALPGDQHGGHPIGGHFVFHDSYEIQGAHIARLATSDERHRAPIHGSPVRVEVPWCGGDAL